MVADEAIKGLIAIVGAGGISGILIAFYAYKSAAMKGRRNVDGETVALSLGDGLLPRATIEALTNAIVSQTLAVNKQCVLMEEILKMERKEAERLELKLLIEEAMKMQKRD